MSEQTKIEWATHTFNPWIGCTKVSPGCAHCYAENTTRARVLRSQGHETWGKGAARNRTSAAMWRQPAKWNRDASPTSSAIQFPPRVFPSLCDWLDDEVPIEWLADFLRLIHDTPNLDWLLLTKRPENWRERLEKAWGYLGGGVAEWLNTWLRGFPVQNVWIGVSVEDQKRADERIPELLRIPARIRFLSAEPLLGPIDFKAVPRPIVPGRPDGNWVIVGGESGPGARPCDVEWIRSIVRQCKAAGVPAFVKQVGSEPLDTTGFPMQKKHRKGGDPSEWPRDLRVREFPEVTR